MNVFRANREIEQRFYKWTTAAIPFYSSLLNQSLGTS